MNVESSSLKFTVESSSLKLPPTSLPAFLRNPVGYEPPRVERPFLGAPYAEHLDAEPNPKVSGAEFLGDPYPEHLAAAVSEHTLPRAPSSRAKP